MLRILLDEIIPGAVAIGLKRRHSALFVIDLPEWESGKYLSTTDEVILSKAHEYGLTLVTYDLSTIPSTLKTWAESGREHSGVILIDDKTIHQSDVGGIIDALEHLWLNEQKHDWLNRVMFLRKHTGK